MRLPAVTAAAVVLAGAAIFAIPASAAPASMVPPAARCVRVTIVTTTVTGSEADLPVRMCGIARRWGPWTCTAPGQFGARMRLACRRG